MKYKLIDGTAIILAGVVSYDSISKSKKVPKPPKPPRHAKMDFDFDIDFDMSKEDLKNLKVIIKEAANNTKQAFKTDKKANEYNFKDFENSINEFGRSMDKWGHDFGKSMDQWAKGFSNKAEQYGAKVDVWAKQFNSRDGEKDYNDKEKDVNDKERKCEIHVVANNMDHIWSNNHKADDYNVWELESLFKDIYLNNPELKDIDLNSDVYYELQSYDLNLKMRDQMTFVGCQVSSINDVPHPLVTQKISAENWLVLKLTKEEFDKDWLSKVEALEITDGYSIESFFIIRHFKDSKQRDKKKVKIYVPLKKAQ